MGAQTSDNNPSMKRLADDISDNQSIRSKQSISGRGAKSLYDGSQSFPSTNEKSVQLIHHSNLMGKYDPNADMRDVGRQGNLEPIGGFGKIVKSANQYQEGVGNGRRYNTNT